MELRSWRRISPAGANTPSMIALLLLVAVVFELLEVGAAQQITFPQMPDKSGTPGFTVTIGGSLSLNNRSGSDFGSPSGYAWEALKLLEDHINTQTRVASDWSHQCLVPEGSDIWKLHCTNDPNNQCGYQMLEENNPTLDECWAACEQEADCAAMEWERNVGCWRVPEEVFSVCVLFGFVRRYDRVIQWRQPIFATRSMDRISVNFEIQDDHGSPELALDLYKQMFASGNYDAFLGPQATDASALVFEELADSSNHLLVTHSEHPAIKRSPDPFTADANVIQGADDDVMEVTLGWEVESGSLGPLAPTPTQLATIDALENWWDIGVGGRMPGLHIRHLMLSTRNTNKSVLSLVLHGTAGDIRSLQKSEEFQRTCDTLETFFFFLEPMPPKPWCHGPLHFNTSTFTVTPVVENSFVNSLDIVLNEGASTITFITFQKGAHRRACGGAEEYARNLNLTVLSSTVVVDESNYHKTVRSAMVQSPDVLLGCGHLEDMAWLTTSMRALSFNPKALLLMEGAEDDYIFNVGAGNAVNVMQPAVALLSATYQSLAFIGTDTSLHQLFVSAHNKTPTAAVSYVEAAVLAILSAYSASNVGKSANLAELRASMVGISVPSLIGTLYWGFSGQVLNTNQLTIQSRPLVGKNPFDTYNFLDRFVVGPDEPVTYPLMSWTEREASVYPCEGGYVLNRLQGECELCPPGKFRSKAALFCRSCGVGFYAELPGLQECRVCEEGMNCTVVGLDRMPDSTAGWYRLEARSHVPPQTEAYLSKAIGSSVYVKCWPENVCLGNNTCSGRNTGILCAHCEEGYTTTTGTDQACGQCPENKAVPILYFATQLFVYLVLALMIVKVFSNTPSSLFMSHSVMLRILVDYLHLASTTYLASSYSVNHVQEIILEVLKSPLETDIMYDCLLRELGYETYQSSTIVALALVPTLLALNMLLVLVYGFIARLFTPASERGSPPSPKSGPLRRGSSSSMPFPSPRRGSSGSLVSHPSIDSFGMGPQSSISRGSSMESIGNASRAFRKNRGRPLRHKHGLGQDIYRSIKEDMVSVWGVVQKPISLTRHTIVKRTFSAFIRSSTVWVYILLPTTMQLLLEGVACVGLDTYRLAADLNVICNSEAHQRWFTVSMVCMTGYGVVLPALVFIKLRLVRKKLMEAKTREKYGFLYVGYQPEYYWFEVVVMIRKVLIYALAALPGLAVKNLALLTLSFLFLILHAILRPFDDRDFYALDNFQFCALLAILAPSLSTLVTNSEALRDTNQVWLKDFSKWVTDGFVIVAHLIVVYQLCQNLMRNLVIKQLIFMQECFPEKLSNFQKILLRIFEGARRPRVRFDPNTNFIDCEGLTASQRKFVVRAFKRTLKQYMIFFERLQAEGTHEAEYWRSILKFHKEDGGNSQAQIIFKPAWLSIAIRKGFQACQSARFTRAEELVREMTTWQRFVARFSAQNKDEETFGRLDSEMPDRTMRRTEVIAYDSVLRSGVTVEELQIALMRLEPLILDGREELFKFQTREAWVEVQLARHKDAIMNVIKLKTNQVDWLTRIQAAAGGESEFSFEELQDILVNAAEESDADFLGIERVVSSVDVLSPNLYPTTSGGYSQWLLACSRFGECDPWSLKAGGTIQEEEGDSSYRYVWEMPSTLANRVHIETYAEVKAETDDLLDRVLELKLIQGLLRREAMKFKAARRSTCNSAAASRNSSPQQKKEVRLQLPPHKRHDEEPRSARRLETAEHEEAEEQTRDNTLDLVELLQWSDAAGAGGVTDSPQRGNVLLREGEAGSRNGTLRSLPSRLPIDARTDWWAHRSVAEPLPQGQPQVSISTLEDEEDYDDDGQSSDEDEVGGSTEVRGFFPKGDSSASIGDDQRTTQPYAAATVSPSLPREVAPRADTLPPLRPAANEPPSSNSSARVHPPRQDVNWFGASLAAHTAFPPQTGPGLLRGALVQPPAEEGDEPPALQDRFLSWLGVGTSAVDQSESQTEGKRNPARWPFGEGMIDMETLPDNTAGLDRQGEEDLEGGQYGPAAMVTL